MPLRLDAVSLTGVEKRRAMWRRVEKTLLLVGLLLVGIYVAAWLHGTVWSRIALWQFENARSAKAASVSEGAGHRGGDPDVSLWSPKRILAYKESLISKVDPPLGVLQIPKLQLAAPVFEGTDDLTLNRGVGRIAGTAQVGESGNLGIAGHRDGFFRVLKDIQVGDSIQLLVANRTIGYRVQRLEIVQPEDTQVLVATADSELTLVTCYPFYFVGNAPQRFIVHAVLESDNQRNSALNSGPRSENPAH
jgi:sortase A